MKKLFILFTFLLLAAVSFSQSRLGSTYQAIKDEFYEPEYKLETGFDEGVRNITIKTSSSNVRYLFNTDNICNATIIVPFTQAKVNGYVELYNSRYTIISSTKWRAYITGVVANINLFSLEDGTMYFVWTPEN